MPCDCLLKINKESFKCEFMKGRENIKTINIDINSGFPSINIIKKTNNIFELNLAQNLILRMKSASNI